MSDLDRPDVSLFGHWICPFSTRVEFALAHRGIDHELINVPPSAARPKDYSVPPEFTAHSPRLEIPLLRVGDEYRADSIPLLEWLEQCFSGSPLLPADERGRALIRKRMSWIDEHAFRPMIGVYYGTDPKRIRRASTRLREALAQLGEWTTESGWLAGPGPTLAEAVMIP
ncbi:MAG: glutathione S-transferase family protein, partial [Actinomycetota bacterium]|nr:glutathione S-transferase family protein [Actinomycetota bacterium]